MMHSTHFIYGYKASDHSDSEETRCSHMGYSFHIAARVLLYALSHRQDIPWSLLHLWWSTGWNQKWLNESTMKDWSDDPSHHQQTLLPQSHISLLMRIIILITTSGCLFPRLQWHEMPNLDEHARLVVGVGGEGLRLFGRDGRVPLDQTGHHSAGRLDPQRQRGNVQQQQVLNRLRLVSRQNGSLHGCGNERKKSLYKCGHNNLSVLWNKCSF